MMKNSVRFLVLLLVFSFGGIQILSQKNLLDSGGERTGEGGTNRFSFGLFAAQFSFMSRSSIIPGVKNPYEYFET